MINIKLEEANSLKIQMQMEGDVQGKADMRFSVISEGVRYSFDAKQVEEGVYEFEFPKMLGKINEGAYDAEIEIIVDGKHFVPLTETVKFTKEAKPTVKLEETSVAAPVASAVKVKLGEVTKKAPPVIVESVRNLLTVSKVDNLIDSGLALAGLNELLNEDSRIMTHGKTELLIKHGNLSEAEVLAALKLVETRGTDLDSLPNVSSIASLSEHVTTALINVLRDKGISSRTLKAHGL